MTVTDDIQTIIRQFPILNEKVNGAKLVYFDNGATTQKPLRVIESMSDFYHHTNANIHRGVHTLSRKATEAYEDARKTIATYFNVADPNQVIFTAGTTDSINIVAEGLAKTYFKAGDEIVVSTYEHHSNILPWQLLAQEKNVKLKVIPLLADQSLDIKSLDTIVTDRTRLIVVAHVSNTLGVISDLDQIKKVAKSKNIPVLVDGAQSAPHMAIDLQKLGVDFFACSAHKMYGPTGIGILYMSARWLKELSQSRTGGGTIKTVTFEKTEYAEGALRFEPGTPNIAAAIGFAEAIRFMQEIGIEFIAQHEHQLVQHAQKKLKEIPDVILYGESENKAGVISLNIKGQHPFDVGTLLDKYGIAVRTGHHCTQPLMQCLNIQGTVRVSFAVYNTIEEVDYFIEKLKEGDQHVNMIMGIKEIGDEIVSEFEVFGDNWESKYEYLIDLGKSLPMIDPALKTEDRIIQGCQSRVWLNAELAEGKLQFTADSDAIITKGMVALMVRALSGQTPEEILKADLFFVDQIGLREHLSPTRANGLVSMINRMKSEALKYLKINN